MAATEGVGAGVGATAGVEAGPALPNMGFPAIEALAWAKAAEGAFKQKQNKKKKKKKKKKITKMKEWSNSANYQKTKSCLFGAGLTLTGSSAFGGCGAATGAGVGSGTLAGTMGAVQAVSLVTVL